MSRPKKSKQIFVHRQGKTQRFTVTVKLACGKEIVAAAEYSKSILWKWSVCLSRTSAITNDFNHPIKDYINCISTDLSAEMMSTQNDGQNSDR